MPAARRRSELEQDLKSVLDELDVFQSKVETSDNSDQANAKLEEDLQKILLNLDDFQMKIEEADEDDIGALKDLLGELQDKLMLGEEMEDIHQPPSAPTSNSTSNNKHKHKKNRARKGATPEAHLELYMQRRARKGTHDLPQAILLQKVIERKQQNQPKSWFHDFLSGKQEPIESRRAGLFPCQKVSLCQEEPASSKSTLKASNSKLKETIVRLEATIAQMDLSYRSDINAHQEVIQKLQSENMKLHEKVYSLKQKQQELVRRDSDASAYEDIVNQLQKENVQLHYKVELLMSQQEEDGDIPPGYLSSSLEDSYSESLFLQEMTSHQPISSSLLKQREASKVASSTSGGGLPFSIVRMH
ncbi:unnamed protein product [Cylindrotheca closterium]|uniref:Uncharacterized protein n=1 Tax=Cylindrotheca closterium TaxID=2856 RepID=A0AAD2G3T9_9STRA|nr:unnamed protein product [Cylindrotheca closterium]